MTTTIKRTLITMRDWRAWLEGLIRSVIEGAASAGLTWASTVVGERIDPSVIQALDFKQALSVLGAAAIIRLFLYLSQKPLPDGSEVED